ncbi:MAG TPA: nucleotide sugar dehydrogenase [Solirubrobacteraceae bacterium]|nr:nucleotide sugar dehydrogenase [Solirubrobacteraceae bacterium]
MSSQRQPIAVIGTGYVGLVTAAGFAELGSEVWCVDVDVDKIARLERGEIPIYEPGLTESVARNRDRLHFGTDLAPALEHARLLFVAVGTPPTYSGDADLSAVHAVVASMPRSDEHALVMKSTVPVGTGASIKRIFAEHGKEGFAYVSCPEFLKEGSALQDFLEPDRVVVGDDGTWAGDAVVDLYAPLNTPVVRTDVASAEMVKLAANAFLATKISFINEIANVCEETGADVLEVARGMGLDQRIGRHFLKPGIGFGGSCFAPEETVLARHRGRTTLLSLERLWQRAAAEHEELEEGLIEPSGLEVLSWVPGGEEPQFLPVMCLTRRDFDGELIDVRTKMGRRVRTTPDHGWIVGDGAGGEAAFKLAGDLTTDDWVPLALGHGEINEAIKVAPLIAAAEAVELSPRQLIVHPAREQIDALVGRPMAERRAVFAGAPSVAARTGVVKRSGAVRLDELLRAGLGLEESGTISTTRSGNQPRSLLRLDGSFWRVVGLYLAEGHASLDGSGRCRLYWSFHPTREEHLVDEVVAYWLAQNVRATVRSGATARSVEVASRLLGTWWTQVLGLGRGSYEQRLPDLIWDQPDEARWDLLSGLFEGDGSWSLVNGGPSVIIEFGTISDELADGVLRLLASVGIVASKRTGRTAKSTKDTHWIRISGADQVARAIRLIPERDRTGALASIAGQRKRIAPTGYRRFGDGPGWVRVTSLGRQPYSGPVYSLEVSYAHTVVASDGVTLGNCFPKDVSALKQLAGNSGYHFQLLTAVIEVNELQKRRVIAKLQKHLGSLVGRRVALLGLAFKANTDDMREASSLVLASRLQGEGAHVCAYDPIAEEEARKRMTGVEFSDSALGAVEGADAAILVTEWPEFGELDWSEVKRRMAGALLIDGRNFADRDSVEAAGFTYEGIGR